jgi:hypothetical protein
MGVQRKVSNAPPPAVWVDIGCNTNGILIVSSLRPEFKLQAVEMIAGHHPSAT